MISGRKRSPSFLQPVGIRSRPVGIISDSDGCRAPAACESIPLPIRPGSRKHLFPRFRFFHCAGRAAEMIRPLSCRPPSPRPVVDQRRQHACVDVPSLRCLRREGLIPRVRRRGRAGHGDRDRRNGYLVSQGTEAVEFRMSGGQDEHRGAAVGPGRRDGRYGRWRLRRPRQGRKYCEAASQPDRQAAVAPTDSVGGRGIRFC